MANLIKGRMEEKKSEFQSTVLSSFNNFSNKLDEA